MTLSAETPPSAVVRMLALEIQSGARFLNSLQGTAKKLAADLDAQERLMGEMVTALREWVAPFGSITDEEAEARGGNVVMQAIKRTRALLARIEGRAHAD